MPLLSLDKGQMKSAMIHGTEETDALLNGIRKDLKNMTVKQIMNICSGLKSMMKDRINKTELDIATEAYISKHAQREITGDDKGICADINRALLHYLEKGGQSNREAVDQLFKHYKLHIENEVDALVFPKDSSTKFIAYNSETGRSYFGEDVTRHACDNFKRNYNEHSAMCRLVYKIRDELTKRLQSFS